MLLEVMLFSIKKMSYHVWKVFLNQQLTLTTLPSWKITLVENHELRIKKGAKRPLCNPDFTSGIGVNDLMLILKHFPRNVKNHYDNRRLNHKREKIYEKYMVCKANLFLLSNFIIWYKCYYLKYHIREEVFHKHLKQTQKLINTHICRFLRR